MRAPWIVLALGLTACVSTSRVGRLEARLSSAEAAQAKSEFELRASMARVEALLENLAGSVTTISEANQRADELHEQVDQLAAQLAARPAVPPSPPRRNQPDPALVYGVPVIGAPVHGKSTALVTIIRAGEYACPYCEKVRATLDQISTSYGDSVRIVYKQFVVHPTTAYPAAYAACAAHRQGKFWDMDKLLWDKTFANREFEAAKIEVLASSIGLDMTRYRADIGGPCQAQVAAEMAELTKFGVAATPAFFINGRYLAGAMPFANFKTLIDEELAKAQAAVKSGVKPAKYYQQEIVKKGRSAL